MIFAVLGLFTMMCLGVFSYEMALREAKQELTKIQAERKALVEAVDELERAVWDLVDLSVENDALREQIADMQDASMEREDKR